MSIWWALAATWRTPSALQAGGIFAGQRRNAGNYFGRNPGESVSTNAQLVQVLTSLDQRLRDVEQWPTQLEVVLDLLGLDREQEKLKQVKSKGNIK